MMRTKGLGVALVALLVLAGCGDDGDESADADYAAFCNAELAVEQAVSQQDPEAVETAFTALAEATPEESKETIDSTIAEAQKFLSSDQGPTPEFEAAYADMIGIVQDKCGFGELDVTATEYEFDGIDDEVDAGPTVITLKNDGKEAHEIAIMRVNDDVDLTADELLALPEEEAMASVTPAGGGFAMPDATGHTVVDMQPGRYLAVCFVPVGTTAEVIESGEEPEGEPHALQGMVSEFTVS